MFALLGLDGKKPFYAEKFNEESGATQSSAIGWLIDNDISFRFDAKTGDLDKIRMDEDTLERFKAEVPNVDLYRYMGMRTGMVLQGSGKDLREYSKA